VTPNLEQAIEEHPTVHDLDEVVERLEDMQNMKSQKRMIVLKDCTLKKIQI